LTGGVAATAATLLNSLDGLQSAYAAGDTLLLQGQTPAGTTVNSTFNVTAATTLGDLVTAINGAFAGTTASINAAGNLVVQGSSTGPSSLSLNVNDSVGNTGGFNWGNHGMTVSTAGKDGDTVEAAIAVFDAQGNARNVSLTFQKQSSNVWNMTAQLNAADGVLQSSSAVGITFNTDGSYRVVSGGVPQITALFTGQTAAQTINLDFGTSGKFDGLTQVGGGSSAAATGQDGYGAGVLSGIAVNLDGTLMGNFSNGKSLALAQLAIASFANPGALTRYGSNYYAASEASGPSQLGVAGSGARGSIEQGALEGSNVNISAEFTRLIVAQNGYQVNAKTITVTNQVLQDLANIIR
jgi:flagellar hook protein FlgE